jgi:hypothetical protein
VLPSRSMRRESHQHSLNSGMMNCSEHSMASYSTSHRHKERDRMMSQKADRTSLFRPDDTVYLMPIDTKERETV